MPTWPSGSKASTANVDAGSDSITSARADIKQNFDNVNDIIDFYDPTGPYATVGEFTKQQYISLQTLSPDSAGQVDWDLTNNQVAQVTLSGDALLGNPTNQQAGATYVIFVKQPGGANYNLSFDSNYKFQNGITPQNTRVNGATDIFVFISDGTSMFGTAIRNLS